MLVFVSVAKFAVVFACGQAYARFDVSKWPILEFCAVA